jgi:hypothetical protein
MKVSSGENCVKDIFYFNDAHFLLNSHFVTQKVAIARRQSLIRN